MFRTIIVDVIQLKEDNLGLSTTDTCNGSITIMCEDFFLEIKAPPSLSLSGMSLVSDFACFPLGRFSVFSIPRTSTTNALTVLISTLGMTVDTRSAFRDIPSHPSSVHPKGRYGTTTKRSVPVSSRRSRQSGRLRRCQQMGERDQALHRWPHQC